MFFKIQFNQQEFSGYKLLIKKSMRNIEINIPRSEMYKSFVIKENL